MKLKETLLDYCSAMVTKRMETIQKTIHSNQLALASETKNSAGDKHETGRAMLQLEMEKAGQQLKDVLQMKAVLERINLSGNFENARLGSLIMTTHGNYFLSVSAGIITLHGNTYFAISTQSPIGKLLLGKKEKASFVFQEKEITILKIV